MEHLVNLVGHLIWPVVVVIFAFIYRRQLAGVVSAIETKIRDPRTGLAVGPSGLKVEPPTKITQRAATAHPTMGLLNEALGADPHLEVRLRDWMKDRGLSVSVTTFLYGQDYESLRLAASQELLNDVESNKEEA